jgi:hypothetical protein
MSVRMLASLTDFYRNFISQVENGNRLLQALERIALALGVSLAEFLERSDATASGIVRAGERSVFENGW